VEASTNVLTQANDLDKLYYAVKGFVFFGVPHTGSDVVDMQRIQILRMMARVAFTQIPPKLEQALKSGSDELLDLTDSFRKISLYQENKLVIISFYELISTAGLGARVRYIHNYGLLSHSSNQ
jgi:hypothetical protein